MYIDEITISGELFNDPAYDLGSCVKSILFFIITSRGAVIEDGDRLKFEVTLVKEADIVGDEQ